jgi:hypothetical protein
MTMNEPDDRHRDEVGVEIEEFLDLPIIDPEQVVKNEQARKEEK